MASRVLRSRNENGIVGPPVELPMSRSGRVLRSRSNVPTTRDQRVSVTPETQHHRSSRSHSFVENSQPPAIKRQRSRSRGVSEDIESSGQHLVDYWITPSSCIVAVKMHPRLLRMLEYSTARDSYAPYHVDLLPHPPDPASYSAHEEPYYGLLKQPDSNRTETALTFETYTQFQTTYFAAQLQRLQRLRSDPDSKWLYYEEQSAPEKRKGSQAGSIVQPASKVKCIRFGDYEIETWYSAPYPEEYSCMGLLYICEYCLKYFNNDYVAWRHELKCSFHRPPGSEIYRDGDISVFEIDGKKEQLYCQNLCLLSRLFLGSKTLYYDVEPFMFYVLTEYNTSGYHFVGYFSKEKRSIALYNVSCILTLPIHQRKGYGSFLIEFSYLLSRSEKRLGTPEKPLSEMGLLSYRAYWKYVIAKYLQQRPEGQAVAINDICRETCMMPDNVISAMESLNALLKDPYTGRYAIRVDRELIDSIVEAWETKNYRRVDPAKLIWTPLILNRHGGIWLPEGIQPDTSSYELDEVDIPAWRYELVYPQTDTRQRPSWMAAYGYSNATRRTSMAAKRIRIEDEDDEDEDEGPEDDLSLDSDSKNDEDYSEVEDEDDADEDADEDAEDEE
ncbi:hypothetical protein CANCADRAFT_32988 [Tortispora caseinolytica NRRL Y-17796]|uniref:Histone acetyltransferase n=1 Tax=Tortispora caseinolytica NRRL Y-17796 TaxID=767744 RepID=A0A1E4T9G6_9ASCO|nr:hypothetical protein CANCADRAFT_32988 [Tortispora caseinolytica NRRL Y-17796]